MPNSASRSALGASWVTLPLGGRGWQRSSIDMTRVALLIRSIARRSSLRGFAAWAGSVAASDAARARVSSRIGWKRKVELTRWELLARRLRRSARGDRVGQPERFASASNDAELLDDAGDLEQAPEDR